MKTGVYTKHPAVNGLFCIVSGCLLVASAIAFSQDSARPVEKPILQAYPEPFLSADEIMVVKSNQKVSGRSIMPSQEPKTNAQDGNADVSFSDLPREQRDGLAKILVDPRNYDSSPILAGDDPNDPIWILLISDGTHVLRIHCGKRMLLIADAEGNKGLHFCLLNGNGSELLHSWIKAAADKYGEQEPWYFQKQVFGDYMTQHEMEILGQNW